MKTLKMSIVTLLIMMMSVTVFAQKSPIINGKIINNRFTDIELKLAYKDDGISFGKATVAKNGSFTMNTMVVKSDIYRLVLSDKDFFLFVLNPGEVIDVTFDANNLQTIISISGSTSMTFVKNAADLLTGNKKIMDSLNNALQIDPLQLYYNGFYQDFHLYHQTNHEVDSFILAVYRTYDTLTQYIALNTEKGTVKSKNMDMFLATVIPYLKSIERDYTPFANYLKNAPEFYNFSKDVNESVQPFYNQVAQTYINVVNQRHQFAFSSLNNLLKEVSRLNSKRDSLVFGEFLSNSKVKKAFVQEILAVLKTNPLQLADEKTYQITFPQTDKAHIDLKELAQQQVKNVVQKYQTAYNNESVKINTDLRKLLVDNKADLAVLMFLDIFKREQDPELHQEVVKALFAKFPDNPLVLERQKIESAPQISTNIGSMAPELAFPNPDGKILKLSDLRGKVVLVDFWAAWCRPCRMENPNVVKEYHHYKDKGFEVFSVSLDRDKASWLKAIQDDGLVWPNHVSDLKYWSSEAAAIYGVTSIPATFLIGKDGRIIAKNLRGEALSNALKQLLGE